MGGDIWEELGIEATNDRAAIRRAYAVRLKLTNPEDDAEAFRMLRRAYEAAMSEAEWIARNEAAELQLETDDAAEAEDGADGAVEPLRHERRLWSSPRGPWGGLDPAPGPRPITPVTPEQIELDRRMDRLEDLLRQEPPPAPQALLDAWEALFAADALQTLEDDRRLEAWALDVLHGADDRRDVLLNAVVRRCGWYGAVGQDVRINDIVLRTEAPAFRLHLLDEDNPFHEAYQGLRRTPTMRQRAAERLSPEAFWRTPIVIERLRRERPDLLADLDPEAVAGWDRRMARPRIKPVTFWALAFAVALATPLVAAPGTFLAAVTFWACVAYVSMLVFAGVPAVLQGLFAPVRRRLAGRRLNPKVRFGWAPLLAAATLAGGILPAGEAVTWGLGAASALLFLWAVLVGEPEDDVRHTWVVAAIRKPDIPVILALLSAAGTTGMTFTAQAAIPALALLCAWRCDGKGLIDAFWRQPLTGVFACAVGVAGAGLAWRLWQTGEAGLTGWVFAAYVVTEWARRPIGPQGGPFTGLVYSLLLLTLATLVWGPAARVIAPLAPAILMIHAGLVGLIVAAGRFARWSRRPAWAEAWG